VFLRGVTWLRDSHGLFDYESKSINKKSLKTNCQGKIVRVNNEIELVTLQKDETELGSDSQILLQIKNESGSKLSSDSIPIPDGFYLDHSPKCDLEEEDSIDRLWLVIRSLKSPEGKYVI
jgi:hypothetical protein